MVIFINLYMEELEKKYLLTIGIPSSDPHALFQTVEDMIHTDNIRELYQARRKKMLADKIDVATYFTNFIEGLK